MFPMIPMIVVALAGTGLYAQKKRGENKMTPERTVIYNHALQNLKDPDKLRTLFLGAC